MGGRRLALVVLVACTGKAASPPPPTAKREVVRLPEKPQPTMGSTADVAPPPAPVVASPGVPVSTVTLAEVGLQAASLDRTVDPCVDFYQFACGGWLAANQIPPDHARWGTFGEVDEKTKVALEQILVAAAAKDEAATKKLGDFYASCIDEAAIEKAGTRAIKPVLDKLLAVKDARSWLAAIVELHRIGIWAGFNTWVDSDFADSTKYITQLDSAVLGLPDRAYYLEADFKAQRDGYEQHVARMLKLAGVTAAETAAADVLAIETELAKLSKTATERRNVRGWNNPTDIKKLAKATKSIDWKAYFKAIGLTPTAKIIVASPAFFAGFDAVRTRFKPAQWRGYFAYQLLVHSAIALPKALDAEAFALRTLISGTLEQPPRAKRCVDATTTALGELLGRAYVEAHFPVPAKQIASALVDAIANAMHDEIGTLDWMTEQTRRTAQDKLARLARLVGFPDRWRTYDFEVRRDDFAGNTLRAAAFDIRRVFARAGKTVDRSEWFMNVFTVDAFYNPSANHAGLPAGILQPPFFGQDRSIAANLGGIGMVIGHELTHGFDDQGAQFDASGNLASWWHPDDKAKFEAKGACLVSMYGTFEVLPKQFLDGALTLGENIADLGGVKMAFKAYRALRSNAQRVFVADGFTEDQQFFLAVAQAWCGKARPAEAQRRLTTDSHAPPKFRVYGALRNLPEFSQAFQCAPGTPMHPAETCSVW